jgi:hypothetical protein
VDTKGVAKSSAAPSRGSDRVNNAPETSVRFAKKRTSHGGIQATKKCEILLWRCRLAFLHRRSGELLGSAGGGAASLLTCWRVVLSLGVFVGWVVALASTTTGADNLSLVCALDKGRAQDWKLFDICRQIAAVSLFCDLRLSVRWIASECNPADEPFRRFELRSHAARHDAGCGAASGAADGAAASAKQSDSGVVRKLVRRHPSAFHPGWSSTCGLSEGQWARVQ